MKAHAVQHPIEMATLLALRQDMALQIARHVQRTGGTQVAVAHLLAIPQPTLSKILRGRVDDLSLELLIRIATRARLQVVLHTGKDPTEAGVFVRGTMSPARASRSRLTDRARKELRVNGLSLNPEQRLDAQLRHSELLASLRRAANSTHPKRR